MPTNLNRSLQWTAFVIFLFHSLSTHATSNYQFKIPDRLKGYECVFKNSLTIGNSVSSGLLDSLDPSEFSAYQPPERINGSSPGDVLAEVYADGADTSDNIAVGVGSLPDGFGFINKILYPEQVYGPAPTKPNFTGPGDVASLTDYDNKLNSYNKKINRRNNYSTFTGIDMFYMSTIFNTCNRYDRDGVKVEDQIKKYVDFAKAENKVLILGTVPNDNPNDFSFLDNLFILGQPRSDCAYWTTYNYRLCVIHKNRLDRNQTPTKHNNASSLISQCDKDAHSYYAQCMRKQVDGIKSCRARINNAIRTHCKDTPHCYISDLEEIVDHLNDGGTYTLSDGRTYNLEMLRPTVNVTEAGTQLIVEQLLEDMTEAKKQPNCVTEEVDVMTQPADS